MQWWAAGYTLAFAVFMIVGGRLGDVFGRRRVFVIGIAGFTLASIACALAPSPTSSSPPASCRAASARCSSRRGSA